MRPALSTTALATLLLWAPAAQGEPPAVVVAEVVSLSFPLAIEALGTARANESVEIRPQISETIIAIHFEEGVRVAAGQKLVSLENTEAVAGVAVARAALLDSDGQLRRARELFKTRAVSASELEQRVARRDADRAALDAAEARQADTVVRAPFAGRLGLRRVSLGALVSPATVITTLDDTETIKLDFDVPETALARLETDLPVLARSAAWPDQVFRGQVASVDTRVDPVSRSVTVRALVPNAEDRLRPGMFLTVTLLREDVRARMIPEQALIPEQSRQYVLVVGADRVAEKRLVKVGRRRPGQVEVLSGLTEGEVIVIEGTQKVRPGEAVEISSRVIVAEPAP